MPDSLSYEVYIRRGDDWMVEFASECRETALDDAKQLFDARVATAVKVIEERFSPDTGEAHQATIFVVDRNRKTYSRRASPAPKHSERLGPATRAISYKPNRTKTAWDLFIQRLTVLVLVVGGLCLGTLIGLAFLFDQKF